MAEYPAAGYNQRMPGYHPLRSVFAAILFLIAALHTSPPISADEQGDEFFEKQVRPILVGRCFSCHSGKLAEGVKVPQGNLREAVIGLVEALNAVRGDISLQCVHAVLNA